MFYQVLQPGIDILEEAFVFSWFSNELEQCADAVAKMLNFSKHSVGDLRWIHSYNKLNIQKKSLLCPHKIAVIRKLSAEIAIAKLYKIQRQLCPIFCSISCTALFLLSYHSFTSFLPSTLSYYEYLSLHYFVFAYFTQCII